MPKRRENYPCLLAGSILSSAAWQAGCRIDRKPMTKDSRMDRSAPSNSPRRTCLATCSQALSSAGSPAPSRKTESKSALLLVGICLFRVEPLVAQRLPHSPVRAEYPHAVLPVAASHLRGIASPPIRVITAIHHSFVYLMRTTECRRQR